MKYTLYGDGIHDDLPAIQEMLDSGVSLVYLPVPKAHYVISDTILVHSGQELRLDRYTRVMLAPGANTYMLRNADPMGGNENVRISGGIWDMNHNEQKPHPFNFRDADTGRTAWEELSARGFRNWIIPIEKDAPGVTKIAGRDFPVDVYTGFCMYFCGVRGFYLGNMTVVNPPLYAMDLYAVENFTIENVEFEFTEGSPKKHNMDGVHLEGYCKNGVIRNLKGACHDDTVALTTDDSYKAGPIENILIDGVFSEGGHSAVRLLSRTYPIRNVHVTNIYGTYYIYAMTISKYSSLPERGIFENVTVDNVYASTCTGTGDVRDSYLPLVYIGDEIDIQNLTVRSLHRRETHCTVPTFGIGRGTRIHTLSLSDCTQQNLLDAPIEFIHNDGVIERLYTHNVDVGSDPFVGGNGEILSHKEG